MSRILLSAAALALLAGCTSPLSDSGQLFGLITPYRIDIVQGNVVTQELHARVKPGMTRQQVAEVLGTPMLTDIFHADRWDYPFTIKRQGAAPQSRTVTVHFKGNLLERIDAPDLPSERDFVASIARGDRKIEPRVLELTEAQRQALPLPPKMSAPAAEPSGPVRDYPPLETAS